MALGFTSLMQLKAEVLFKIEVQVFGVRETFERRWEFRSGTEPLLQGSCLLLKDQRTVVALAERRLTEKQQTWAVSHLQGEEGLKISHFKPS